MQEGENSNQLINTVWVFNGNRNHFPSGVFTDKQLAENWIKGNELTGTLTAYSLNQGVYNWALEKGYFKPKQGEQVTPTFIGNFSSASQSHEHYEDGE